MKGSMHHFYDTFMKKLEGVVAQNMTEDQIQRMIGKMEAAEGTYLLASINVFYKATCADNEKFRADKLEAMVIEFGFLSDFTSALRNVLGRMRTERERRRMAHGEPANTEVPAERGSVSREGKV